MDENHDTKCDCGLSERAAWDSIINTLAANVDLLSGLMKRAGAALNDSRRKRLEVLLRREKADLEFWRLCRTRWPKL